MEKASIFRESRPTWTRSAEDRLRFGLLICALLANLGPIYKFVGSMIWFREYLGDYQVFWGITKVPLDQIYDHHVFAYPPTTMLLLAPFGLLGFWPSLVAWSATGAAAITCAARRLMGPLAITLGFLTYSGIGVLLGGQIGLFVGALIMAALGTSQPRLRGILLAAAAVIKPRHCWPRRSRWSQGATGKQSAGPWPLDAVSYYSQWPFSGLTFGSAGSLNCRNFTLT